MSVLDPIIDRRNRESTMGLGEHLEDLRRRVIYALVGLIPLVVLSITFSEYLVAIMLKPLLHALALEGQVVQLQATGPLESFAGWFKITLVVAAVGGGPWILYQLWKFVAPGLYTHERRFAYVLAPLSTILTICGLLVMYYIMLPVGLRWLINFGSTLVPETVATAPLPPGLVLPKPLPILAADPPNPQVGEMWINAHLHSIRVALPAGDVVTPEMVADQSPTGQLAKLPVEVRGITLTRSGTIAQQYRFKEYVDLFFGLTLAFALSFQLPVVILLLGWAGLVTPEWLSKYRRHAIIGSLVLGAAITPTPDPISLLMVQVPLYLLYELGILLLRFLPASRIVGKKPEMDGDGGGP